MKLNEIPILDFGNKIGLIGMVLSDDETAYLCLYPGQEMPKTTVPLELNDQDWKKLILQLDVQEVEVLKKAADGQLAKVIVRKTQRLIEQRVSWAVYQRDGYRCRYCGAEGVPLTVDHLVTWEDGGPSTEENLVSCCRSCNKRRGNLSLRDWLRHPYYLRVYKNLTPEQRQANERLLPAIDIVQRRVSERVSR